MLHLGPMVTHNAAAASKLIRERAYPLARASWEVGAAQIRNRATIAGNLITASPANDTITPLMALGAWLILKSTRGERKVLLQDFYTGVRKTVLQPDEMLVDIAFPRHAGQSARHIREIGLAPCPGDLRGQRRHAADLRSDASPFGLRSPWDSVAPTIIHASAAEEYLVGKKLSQRTIARSAELTAEAPPGPSMTCAVSGSYRRATARVLTRRGLSAIAAGTERSGFPDDPGAARGKCAEPSRGKGHGSLPGRRTHPGQRSTARNTPSRTAATKKPCCACCVRRRLDWHQGRLCRGRCGACTVFLDGKAVTACLGNRTVPTWRKLSPWRAFRRRKTTSGAEAFIQDGAVQCGYCSPGFLMSAAMLLEEKPHPQRDEITQAITGTSAGAPVTIRSSRRSRMSPSSTLRPDARVAAQAWNCAKIGVVNG